MRYLITFSYDGSKYYGYQKQLNEITIQSVLEETLKTINEKPVSVVASGRTDRGVHAINQKAHFDLDINIEPSNLKKAMNSLLPGDIYVKDVNIVSDEFHARFSVLKKEYIYKINLGEYNPLEKDYIYQYNNKLNISDMKKAIKLFIGKHDFKSFTSAKDIRDDYTRTIFKASITVKNNIMTISFVGTGFMRYMVRNMVGLLIEVGEGKRSYKDVDVIFKSLDRKASGKTAPAEGLYLKEVIYK